MKNVLKTTLTLILMVGILFSFSACGEKKEDEATSNKNPIVGSWKYDGGGYTYTFNEDGTGKYENGISALEFTYETKDGNILSILYTGSTVPFETEYKIEGDTLNVIDSFGSDTIYKKVK